MPLDMLLPLRESAAMNGICELVHNTTFLPGTVYVTSTSATVFPGYDP